MIRMLTATVAAMLGCASPASATVRFTDVTQTHLPAPPENGMATMDAAAVDIDGDGDLDIVTPQEWRSNRLLINDGGGRFTLREDAFPAPPQAELVRPAHIQQPLQKDSEDVSIADFNGDDLLDIIIVSEDDVTFGRQHVHQYFRGRADGSYERIYGQLPDTIANAVADADLNGDGRADLLISGAGQDRLLINDASGFRDETEARLPSETATAQDAEFADLDADGDVDLVLGLEGGHALWINDGTGRFADETTSRLPNAGNVEARKVTPADIDGDGYLDLYFSHVGWQGRAPQDRLYINDGRGRFTDETLARLGPESDLTLDAKFADLDADGDLDLVQGNAGLVRIFLNDGQGRFADVTQAALGLSGGLEGAAISLELADFNGDGRIDIFVGQIGGGGAPVRDRLFLQQAP